LKQLFYPVGDVTGKVANNKRDVFCLYSVVLDDIQSFIDHSQQTPPYCPLAQLIPVPVLTTI